MEPLRYPKFGARFALAAVVVLVTSLLAGCGSPDASIVIDREVRIEGLGGTPDAIVSTSDGGFVIAGAWNDAWAVGTTSTGTMRWKYDEPPAAFDTSPIRSDFRGAVMLANGNVLLCGQHDTPAHQAGTALVTILGPNGELVEHRDVLPPDGNARIILSSIDACFHWGDGVALVGGGSDGYRASHWLLKLDKNGAEEWGRLIELYLLNSAAQAPDGDLIIAGTLVKNGAFAAQLIEFNRQGLPVAQRLIDESIVRSVIVRTMSTPAAHLQVLCYGGAEVRLFTLNNALQDAVPPKRVGGPYVGFPAGSAYSLPDASVALFGANGRAAVGHVARPGKSDALHVFPLPSAAGSTFTVGDAAPVSENQFVAVRPEVPAANPSQDRMVLSWITFH
jgi:hypothetical protein